MFFSSLQFAISNSSYSNINLKAKQVKCLEAIYLGRDVVAVLPTGYGKSMIFHLLPSLLYDKMISGRPASSSPVRPVIIVVSPLNALMKDQIRKTSEGNVSATFLNVRKKKESSDLELDVSDASQRMLKDAKYDIIYTHPEAFISCKDGMELFQSPPYQHSVQVVVVDEAHCILEWLVLFRIMFFPLKLKCVLLNIKYLYNDVIRQLNKSLCRSGKCFVL